LLLEVQSSLLQALDTRGVVPLGPTVKAAARSMF
jgi:hypothetical protein